MADEEEIFKLSIDAGEGGFVLSVDNGEEGRASLTLSEENLVYLGRLAPIIARQLIAAKVQVKGDVSVAVASPATAFQIFSDVHGDAVLLRIEDEIGGEFDFAMTPDSARELGERLIDFAERTAKAPKMTPQ